MSYSICPTSEHRDPRYQQVDFARPVTWRPAVSILFAYANARFRRVARWFKLVPSNRRKRGTRRTRQARRQSSFNLQQLHLKDQRGVGRNVGAGAALAVGQLGRNRQLALAAHFHAGDAFVPTLDDFAGAEL